MRIRPTSLRAQAWRVCVLTTLLYAFAPPRCAIAAAPAHLPTLTSVPGALDPFDVLPIDPGRRVIAIVAADIDGDGDLDVVANDGSLDLLVWVNDGTGHLTRKSASHHRSVRPDGPGPRVGSRVGDAVVVTVSDPPLTSASAGAPRLVFGSRQLPLRPSADVPANAWDSSRSPRAPPAPLPLF